MAARRPLLRAAQLLQLRVAADERREPARAPRLQPRARRADPGQLVDLDRLGEPLDRHRAQRFTARSLRRARASTA